MCKYKEASHDMFLDERRLLCRGFELSSYSMQCYLRCSAQNKQVRNFYHFQGSVFYVLKEIQKGANWCSS